MPNEPFQARSRSMLHGLRSMTKIGLRCLLSSSGRCGLLI